MFARRVAMVLKPDSAADFTQRLEEKVLPLLRKHKGFQDELTCISADGTKAFGLSLWDEKESAETYVRDTYPEVAKIVLGGVVREITDIKLHGHSVSFLIWPRKARRVM